MSNPSSNDLNRRVALATLIGEGSSDPPGETAVIDFDSDTPLVCNRDQSGDTTCESCQ